VPFLVADAPDIVGFSCFTYQRAQTLEIARRIKERKAARSPLVILGGPHASPLAGEILARCPWVDGVVQGEGEKTLRELAERLERRADLAGTPGYWCRRDGVTVKGPPRPLADNLDELPSIADADHEIAGVDPLFQLRHLVTGRGCSARCTFCYAPSGWHGCVRSHSVEWIVHELSALKKRHGLAYVSFRDDTFTDDQAWTKELCARLVATRADLLWDCQSRVNRLDYDTVAWMRRAGCVQIQLGVESGSDTVLKYLRKPFNVARLRSAVAACRRVGMRVSFYLICGVPGECKADLDATERLVAELRPASLVVSRLTLFPGTPLGADIPPARWFEDEADHIYARNDARALAAAARLDALAHRVAAEEPFTPEELGRAAAALGDAPPVLVNLAQLYERLDNLEAAEAACRRALEVQPGYLWAALELGAMLLEGGRPREALPHLASVVDRVPAWPYARECLAQARAAAGK
jgi:anaerobic magnesium-protoporphyrin IX monomethyl ester cyclase